jgi:hypothetical protein
MTVCAACHSEVRTREIRGSGKMLTTTNPTSPNQSTNYPIGTVSWCPVHGFGFPIRLN